MGTLFSNHIPDYRNLITSYSTLAPVGASLLAMTVEQSLMF
ncbi:hypothetical protein EMIT0196MI5_150056 [Pseudomonas sp. IT-196MI5]